MVSDVAPCLRHDPDLSQSLMCHLKTPISTMHMLDYRCISGLYHSNYSPYTIFVQETPSQEFKADSQQTMVHNNNVVR